MKNPGGDRAAKRGDGPHQGLEPAKICTRRQFVFEGRHGLPPFSLRTHALLVPVKPAERFLDPQQMVTIDDYFLHSCYPAPLRAEPPDGGRILAAVRLLDLGDEKTNEPVPQGLQGAKRNTRSPVRAEDFF